MRLNANDPEAVRRANVRADERDCRRDLLRSLRVNLSGYSRGYLHAVIADLSKRRHLSRKAAGELKALLHGGARR